MPVRALLMLLLLLLRFPAAYSGFRFSFSPQLPIGFWGRFLAVPIQRPKSHLGGELQRGGGIPFTSTSFTSFLHAITPPPPFLPSYATGFDKKPRPVFVFNI
jgi:hypothetical protein